MAEVKSETYDHGSQRAACPQCGSCLIRTATNTCGWCGIKRPASPKPAEPKQWEHHCRAWGGRRWLLNVGEDCGACDVTYEQAKELAVYPSAPRGEAFGGGEVIRCDACGKDVTMTVRVSTDNGSNLCWTCFSSPKQPEAGPVVRKAQRFSFGDVVSNDDNGKEYRVEAALATGRYDVTSLETGRRFNECRLHNVTFVRHAPSPAKPPGGGEGEVERVVATRDNWIVGIDWASDIRTIPADSALAEVERQSALLSRALFDLKMLRLLGRGYSRNDLLADLARKSKGGK